MINSYLYGSHSSHKPCATLTLSLSLHCYIKQLLYVPITKKWRKKAINYVFADPELPRAEKLLQSTASVLTCPRLFLKTLQYQEWQYLALSYTCHASLEQDRTLGYREHETHFKHLNLLPDHLHSIWLPSWKQGSSLSHLASLRDALSSSLKQPAVG